MFDLNISPSIVYWSNPIQSGLIFGTVFLFMVSLCFNSLITVVSYTLLIIMTMVASLKLYTNVMVKLKKADASSDPLAPLYNHPLTIANQSISDMSPRIADSINMFTRELRALFFIENHVDTIKFCLSLYSLTYIGAWFNALTLLILAWVGAFTFPKLYQMNKHEVDKAMDVINSKVEMVKEKIESFLPPGMKTNKVSAEEKEK